MFVMCELCLVIKGVMNNGNNRIDRFMFQHSRRVDGYKYVELYAILWVYVINYRQRAMDWLWRWKRGI